MKSNLLLILCVIAIASVALTIGYVTTHQQKLALRDPYNAPPESPSESRVAGAGIVESAERNVSIGAFNSGIVSEVRVKPGDYAKSGDVLLRLDSRAAAAEVAFQTTVLQVAAEQLDELKSQPRPEDIPIAEAAVNSADAALQQAIQNLKRAQPLATEKAISPQELEASVEAELVARANLASAKATLDKLLAGAWKADLKIAEAQVAQAKAALDQANVNLALQTVTAPSDGEVLQVNVRVGELVTNFQPSALIVFGDTSRLLVRVDIDEVDIPRFENTNRAIAYRRGDAKTQVELKLVRIDPIVIPKQTLTGETQERIDTRVLQAVFEVEKNDKTPTLYVGQQLDVFAM